jgi:hypothetical protein
VTLCAATKNEADNMERALITLQADYVIVGPNSIWGSFQMTPVTHQVLDRLVPRQRSGSHSEGDHHRLENARRAAPRLSVRQESSETTARPVAPIVIEKCPSFGTQSMFSYVRGRLRSSCSGCTAQILPAIARCAGTARTGDGFRELP